MNMENRKWHNALTHVRVDFSHNETSSLLRGEGEGGRGFVLKFSLLLVVVVGGGGVNRRDPEIENRTCQYQNEEALRDSE